MHLQHPTSIPVRRTIEAIEPPLHGHRCAACERRFPSASELWLHEHRCRPLSAPF